MPAVALQSLVLSPDMEINAYLFIYLLCIHMNHMV